MKPIPNPRQLPLLKGLTYDVAATAPSGQALRIAFTPLRGGPASASLVKGARARSLPPDQQAGEPWYLRYRRNDGREAWLRCGSALDIAGSLEKAAYTLAELRSGDAARFDRYLSQIQERSTLTIGRLATQWATLGYPRPDGHPRTPTERRGIVQYLDIARRWWDSIGVTTINRRTWNDYVSARRGQVADRFASQGGESGENAGRPVPTGDRSIDLERNALRCLMAWAVANERCAANPFAAFPRTRSATAVVSCNQQMPASDEEFHRISAQLIGDGAPTPQLVAGAQLLLQGLTGLRPGEPGALRWEAQSGTQRHGAGFLHTVTLGGETRRRLSVDREKGGMTPYVPIHPALDSFIAAWRTYHHTHWPTSPWWFPAPWDPDQPLVPFGRSGDSRLSRYVAQAIADLRIPYRRAHAWRAYYVRVRRSQDTSDGQIADELGERTGESIVRSTYGDPDGIRGDGMFDWLPAEGEPVWDWFAPKDGTRDVIQFKTPISSVA